MITKAYWLVLITLHLLIFSKAFIISEAHNVEPLQDFGFCRNSRTKFCWQYIMYSFIYFTLLPRGLLKLLLVYLCLTHLAASHLSYFFLRLNYFVFPNLSHGAPQKPYGSFLVMNIFILISIVSAQSKILRVSTITQSYKLFLSVVSSRVLSFNKILSIRTKIYQDYLFPMSVRLCNYHEQRLQGQYCSFLYCQFSLLTSYSVPNTFSLR